MLIPPFTVIANIGEAASILTQQTMAAANSNHISLHFNFDNSPIPAEWKDGIIQQLNQMPDIFSQNNLDFGCTDQVRHHIKLHYETLFKHCARPIHPHYIEAVRNNLRDLLEACNRGFYVLLWIKVVVGVRRSHFGWRKGVALNKAQTMILCDHVPHVFSFSRVFAKINISIIYTIYNCAL